MAEPYDNTVPQVRMEKVKCPDRRKEQKTILSSFERRKHADRRKSIRYFFVNRYTLDPADPIVEQG